MALVNDSSQPNLNYLLNAVRDVRVLSLNMKAFGYELAQRLADVLPPRTDTQAQTIGLSSKMSVQGDIESEWVAHWCAELRTPVLYHRKLWELAYVLQAMHEGGVLRPGARALGFGCGGEPIASYLAAQGLGVTVTDLPIEASKGLGWIETNQHASSLDSAYHPGFLSRELFDQRVAFRPVDMMAIPADLTGYDACWSICALEHLGSIANGLAFIRRSLDTLRPGGVAVHTTEFNIESEGPTIDNWPSVLFQRRHMERLAAELEADGHHVAPFDFALGEQPLDRFIDVPPFIHDLPEEWAKWMGAPAHLKVSVDGFVATCFGLVVTKGG